MNFARQLGSFSRYDGLRNSSRPNSSQHWLVRSGAELRHSGVNDQAGDISIVVALVEDAELVKLLRSLESLDSI